LPLQIGTRVGPYEILSAIGAGGMGEVWKARDTRLDRIVAIKTIHGTFSERFEREARAISALNHPHICALYDVGRLRVSDASASQGAEVDYLVMEFVEGTPLKGPLPLDQALKYAAQVCDALDAAHRKGIVHRSPTTSWSPRPASSCSTSVSRRLRRTGQERQEGQEGKTRKARTRRSRRCSPAST
jgi:eukaryotic-like serine/threonine-protein kinase